MTANDERTAVDPGTRLCGYCGDAFDPEGNTAKLYCTPVHRKQASERRRRGRDPRQPKERTLTCPWCLAEFTTRLDNQVYCGAGHRRLAAACEGQRGFLTLPAAEAAAAETPGRVEPWQCDRPGTPHWHLRDAGQASGVARTAEATP